MNYKKILKKIPVMDRITYDHNLFKNYNVLYQSDEKDFIAKHFWSTKIIKDNRKTNQILKTLRSIKINPVDNGDFFYSLDPFVHLQSEYKIFDNYSIDYSWVVYSSIRDQIEKAEIKDSVFKSEMESLVDGISYYISRCRLKQNEQRRYYLNINEIESLLSRPAEHFHEALQRILFVNQLIWQTEHKNIGLGHLDWILYELFHKDLSDGVISISTGKKMIASFLSALHEYYWYKSSILIGDTGQIIILGGLDSKEHYKCNLLTYLFIDTLKELRLPDPKLLLRVSKYMPEDLIEKAAECISSGIGCPLISNDDVIIDKLIQYGYEENEAYSYGTSACWEPLIPGASCDQNNIEPFNFAKPFINTIEDKRFQSVRNIDDIKTIYFEHLGTYIKATMKRLGTIQFEKDPILTLFTFESLKRGKDITRGGIKYNDLGMTSVGISTVINSLLNLDDYVFKTKKVTKEELEEYRKTNYENADSICSELKTNEHSFGRDYSDVIELTDDIMTFASREMQKYRTLYNGRYKVGYSSPSYIIESSNLPATYDGRHNNEPFSVHISSRGGATPTEQIRFAGNLDYNENRINGNVLDLVVPYSVGKNLSLLVALIKGAISEKVFQMQFNLLDSDMLIKAKEHPELYPGLIVRVWGFSAYFNDLPVEYQDNLIRRAIEAEKVA